jgi:hypothetical protein
MSRARRSVVRASAWAPDRYWASARSAQRRSRTGPCATRARASARTPACRPMRRLASITDSSASSRNSSRRSTSACAGGHSSTSRRAGPRHKASASRNTWMARSGSPKASIWCPFDTSRSNRRASISSSVTASRYPCGEVSIDWAPSSLRSRLTQPATTLLQEAGGWSGHRTSASWSVDVARPPRTTSAERTTRSRGESEPMPSTVRGPGTPMCMQPNVRGCGAPVNTPDNGLIPGRRPADNPWGCSCRKSLVPRHRGAMP